MGDTEEDVGQLRDMMGKEPVEAVEDPLLSSLINAMFAKDGLPLPLRSTDGSIAFL